MRLKYIIALFTIGLMLFSCKQEEKFDGYIVSGEVKGMDTGLVKLIKYDFTDRSASPKAIDSAEIVNGKFKFKGNVKNPDRVMLLFGKDYRSEFFLENSKISLKLDIADSNRGDIKAIVIGSELQKIYDAQQSKIESIMNKEKYDVLKEIRPKMAEAYDSKDEAKIKAFRAWRSQFSELEKERNNERRDFMIQYAKDHPASAVAPWVLGFQFSEGRMSKEEMKEIYPIFKGAAKGTAMFKYYKKTYDDIFKSLGIGSKAPDFTLKSVNNEEIQLSKIDAKYKLVDFWASWCVPCRASFPHLKELYTKYNKNGFEIVGIGTADEESKWRKAIIKDETPWIHLYDKGEEGSRKGAYGEVSVLYGVPFLPTTFLMDENEKIILRNPSKEELDVKLKELFGY